MRKIFSCLLIVLISHTALFAQKKKGKSSTSDNLTEAELNLWDDAEYFYDQKNYFRAITAFEQLAKDHPTDAYFNYMTGICYLYKNDEKEKSITYLVNASKIDPKLEDMDFFLGRAFHLNYKFDEAIAYFQSYINSNPPSQKKKTAEHYIEYCNNGKKLVEDEVEIQIDNVGEPVNSISGEYVPVISADETVLIFTYRGPKSTGGLMNTKFQPDKDGDYYEDIFICHKLDGKWQAPQSIGTNINTKGHDASIALSADGQKLFIFKSTLKDKGDIYMSILKGNEWSTPERLGKNINTSSWEGSVCLSSDEKTLYFASERPGGFGDRDLYVSKKTAKGEWGTAVNLGPRINTPYSDDAPFLLADGKTLYFSSEGHNSMGGDDVFYTTITDSGYTEPVNLGYPVNTTDDDIYYVISPDGDRAYFSSNRKGGFGAQDIFTATGLPKKPVLALVVGFVTLNNKPVDATINVTDSLTGDNKGTFHSNSASGKYIVALTPGVNYKVAFEVEGQEHIEYVNVKKIETFVQADYDVKMYTPDFKKDSNMTVMDTTNGLQNKLTTQINKFDEQNKPEMCQARVYKSLIQTQGGVQKDGTSFVVVLGTYENDKEFNADKIKFLGAIDSRKDAFGHTIFTMGVFGTLYEADRLKRQIVDEDPTFADSYVEVNVNGSRKLMPEYFKKEYTEAGCPVIPQPKVIASKSGVVSLQNDAEYDKIVADNGNKVIEGLSYKVEVCSTRDSGHFDVTRLEKYGKVEKKTYPDGVTRYTMGPFKTLKESEDFKQMLIKNEPNLNCSFVTVFYFGKQKSVKEQFLPKDTVSTVTTGPCKPDPTLDFSAFVDKDLNDKEVYGRLMAMGGGTFCVDGLIFTVQIGAYRHPENFKYSQLKSFGPATIINYPDGITRFTMKQFSTLHDAEAFRQQCIAKGIRDAWITGIYQNKRILLPELIKVNFYNKGVN